MNNGHQTVLSSAIKNYKFDKLVAEGTFSRVYQARDSKNNTVAIKAFPKYWIDQNPAFKELYKDEICILKTCQNQNVIKLIQKFESKRTLFTVIQFCNGGSLQELCRKKRINESQARDVIKQVLNGFKGLHRIKAMHRDLKPIHILFHDNKVKIAGFTFSIILDSLESLAQTPLGTAFFMSPQILRGDPYGIQSDIWSVGVILYKMIYSKYPFEGVNDDEILLKIEQGSVPNYKSVNISDQCKDFLNKCFIKEPQKRIKWKQIYEHPFICENTKNILSISEKSDTEDKSTKYSRKQKGLNFVSIKKILKLQQSEAIDKLLEQLQNQVRILVDTIQRKIKQISEQLQSKYFSKNPFLTEGEIKEQQKVLGQFCQFMLNSIKQMKPQLISYKQYQMVNTSINNTTLNSTSNAIKVMKVIKQQSIEQKLKKQVQFYKKQLKSKQQQINKLSIRIKQTQQKSMLFQKKTTTLQQQLCQEIKNIYNLRQQLNKSQNQYKKRQQKIKQQHGMNFYQFSNRQKILQEQKNKLKKQKIQLQNQNNQLQKWTNQLKKQINQLKRQIVQQKKVIQKVQQQNSKVQKQNKNFMIIKNKLQKQIKRYQDQIKESIKYKQLQKYIDNINNPLKINRNKFQSIQPQTDNGNTPNEANDKLNMNKVNKQIVKLKPIQENKVKQNIKQLYIISKDNSVKIISQLLNSIYNKHKQIGKNYIQNKNNQINKFKKSDKQISQQTSSKQTNFSKDNEICQIVVIEQGEQNNQKIDDNDKHKQSIFTISTNANSLSNTQINKLSIYDQIQQHSSAMTQSQSDKILKFDRVILSKQNDKIQYLQQCIELFSSSKIKQVKLKYKKSSLAKNFTLTIKQQLFVNLQQQFIIAVVIIFLTKNNNKFAIYCDRNNKNQINSKLINLQKMKFFSSIKGTTATPFKQQNKGNIISFGSREIIIKNISPQLLNIDFDVGGKYYDIENVKDLTNQKQNKVTLEEIQVYSVRFQSKKEYVK